MFFTNGAKSLNESKKGTITQRSGIAILLVPILGRFLGWSEELSMAVVGAITALSAFYLQKQSRIDEEKAKNAEFGVRGSESGIREKVTL